MSKTTIERTGKGAKLWSLAGTVCVCYGFWIGVNDKSPAGVPLFMAGLGMIVLGKVLRWWGND